MTGITGFGAYVPIYRLSQDTIAQAWGSTPGRGEKAVANYDEDSITMAAEAAIDCLKGMDREQIDGLYFASTMPPYREKQAASIVAAATDLRRDVFTADFGDSLRAGTSAIRAGIDAVKAGSAKEVLVVASDCRLPAPDSEFELLFGDGAAALLLGDLDVIVNIEGSYSISSEFMDFWRTEQDRYPRTWEDRFISLGYVELVQETVSGLMQRHSLAPKDITKAIFYTPDARRHLEVARGLGFDAKTQLQDPMFDRLGNTGAAFSLMLLVAALEEAKSGDLLLFASYGDGCDAYLLRVTEQIEKMEEGRGIKHHLSSKLMLPGYGKYLHFRNLMEWEVERRSPDRSSLNMLWRERNQVFRFRAQRCRNCGGIQFPQGRLCTWCQSKDYFEEMRLSDKKGTLFTFSLDERAMEADLPNVLAIVDLEGGGRFYSQVTDREPEKLEVGMWMEPTFRKIHDGSGVHNYFWKVRPIRGKV